MSVCIDFITPKQLEAKQLFDELVKRGRRIVVTSAEFPFVKMGTAQEALRGIEVNQLDNGYEVRVCSFANRSDLQLFSAVTDAMKSLTGMKALYVGDKEQEIVNPQKDLGDEWIEEQLEGSLRVNCALVKHFGQPVIMDGLFFPFCFGPHIIRHFDIDLDDPFIEDIHMIQDYLLGLQWKFADMKDTSTRMLINNPDDEDDRPLSVSLICAKDNKVMDFDFISYADIICLMDQDTEKVVTIHMRDLWKILPPEGFVFMDDYQFAKEGELSYEDFKEMMDKARYFQVEDLFHKPTFPGNGYDDKQKTYVLMWNPAISSMKLEDHIESIPDIMTEHFNWSVYEYKNARKGDRFVMVRCGEGKTGIVMSGVFDSNPYQAGDWSGKGRTVFYMDMTPNFIADPETAEIITTTELQETIPSFNWSGGHSGRLLTDEQARQLESLLSDYLIKISENIDGETVNGYELPQDHNDE